MLFLQVEEIGESGVAETKVVEGLLKKAYKEESKKGLTETQRKTMKKVRGIFWERTCRMRCSLAANPSQLPNQPLTGQLPALGWKNSCKINIEEL